MGRRWLEGREYSDWQAGGGSAKQTRVLVPKKGKGSVSPPPCGLLHVPPAYVPSQTNGASGRNPHLFQAPCLFLGAAFPVAGTDTHSFNGILWSQALPLFSGSFCRRKCSLQLSLPANTSLRGRQRLQSLDSSGFYG